METCSRCGQSGHIEYGADGLAYCNSCIFYGLNKPCWKCRMYLPASELQQHRGQLTCQYCIMDLRDEERRMEDRGKTKERDRGLGEERQEDRCERCGRTLTIAYFYHNKRLCASCTEQEKGGWEGKGGDAPVVAYRMRKDKGMLSTVVEAVERKIRDAINDKINDKQPEEVSKDNKEEPKGHKKESKEQGKGEKKPMEEKLAKTSGMKYELADYKDIKIDEPKKQETRKDEPEKKSENTEETQDTEKAGERKEKPEEKQDRKTIERKETPEEKYKKHRKKRDETRSKRKEKKKDEKN